MLITVQCAFKCVQINIKMCFCVKVMLSVRRCYLWDGVICETVLSVRRCYVWDGVICEKKTRRKKLFFLEDMFFNNEVICYNFNSFVLWVLLLTLCLTYLWLHYTTCTCYYMVLTSFQSTVNTRLDHISQSNNHICQLLGQTEACSL